MSANTHPVGSGTTPPWVEAELDKLRSYIKAEKMTKATMDSYSRSVHDFLLFVGKSAESLTKKDIQAYKEKIAEDYCENSMINMIAAVNLYSGRIYDRLDLKIRSPRPVQKDKIPLTEVEVKRMLEEARKPRIGKKAFPRTADFGLRDHCAICLMYYGMLRASEASNIRMSGLDLESRRIRIHAGKGKNYETVNITEYAVESIRNYLERGRPKPTPGNEDILLLSSKGSRLGRNALWKMVKRVAFWAGIEKNVHPHIFRHSAITHMSEKGLSPSFIQAQSRHKSLDDVMKYTHLSDKVTREAYDRVFSEAERLQTPVQRVPSPSSTTQLVTVERRNPETIRERILLRYLEGDISDEKLEKLLSLIDQQPQKERRDGQGRMPGYF